MSKTVSIDQLAAEINAGLEEYANVANTRMKSAVRKAAKTVVSEISTNAPVKTGRYAASWRAKTTEESNHKLVQTVHSPKRYMLAHLLEKGHAKRGGGRVAGIPHIAPAEEEGIQQLEELLKKAMEG